VGSGDGRDPIEAFLDEQLIDARAAAEPLLRALPHVAEVASVVLYGSRLAPSTARADSEPDFYAVVGSLRAFHRGLAATALASVLPPTVYHLPLDGSGAAKLCVLSSAQLARETSPAAADLHHLGRFSKRLGLAFARDPAARREIARAQRSAATVLARHALHRLGPRFSLDDFLLALLGLSYLGEPRVAEPDKVPALLAAHRDHYRALGLLLLAERPEVERRGDRFSQPPPTERERDETRALVARSRSRALLRWPKYLLTFDGWLDYALRKLERHTGRRLVLGPRERRHPVLLAWPRLLALAREGLVA